MNAIQNFISITLISARRDKVFLSLLSVATLLFFVLIPAFSSMSMRQVREVAVSSSLSAISLFMFLLTVFFGITILYRDIEKRFIHAVLPLPYSRTEYIVSKFSALCLLLTVGMAALALLATGGILSTEMIWGGERPMQWDLLLLAVFFEHIKFLIIAAIVFFFSTFATSIFTPLFASVLIYIVGNASQTAFDYINSPHGQTLPAFVSSMGKFAYYLIPNLSRFDLKMNAIYGVHPSFIDIFSILLYGLLFIAIFLCLSVMVFLRRELS